MFTTSLYKIDYLIKDKETLEENKETLEEIRKKLLAIYSKYINVSSKTTLDTLPLHRAYNYKIKLETKNNLSYYSLYY